MTKQALRGLALCTPRVHWLTTDCVALVGCLHAEVMDFVETRPIPPCSEVAAPGWEVSTFPDFVHRVDDSAPQSQAVPDRLLRRTGAGLATADLDEDGHLDLLFTSHVGGNRVFRGLEDGRGTHSSSEHALFFGLGDAEQATLQVRWPDGEQTVFDTNCVRCRLRVSRP